MSLAIASVVVLVLCLASIGLSITGIIGRIPGFSAGAGKPTAAATHGAAPGAARRTPGANGMLADEASSANRGIRPDSPIPGSTAIAY